VASPLDAVASPLDAVASPLDAVVWQPDAAGLTDLRPQRPHPAVLQLQRALEFLDATLQR